MIATVEAEENKIVLDKTAAAKPRPFVVAGIPAYNEEKTIARVVLQAQKYAKRVVVCDDGSKDLTGKIAERLGADVVKHDRNLGYGAAIQTLFKRALELGADVLVTLDADGQHSPAEIPQVAEPVLSGKADIVIGSRFVDERLSRAMPWYRRTGIKFITRLTNGDSEANSVRDAQSGFRAYSRRALEKLVLFEDGMGVSSEILINSRKQGLKIREVAASCVYGEEVKTSRNPVRHGASVVGSIVKIMVEEKPLITLGLPGILFLITGAFFGVWMLQIYAAQRVIETNIALASIGFVMIGFFCLSTAITLYAISRLARKTGNYRTT